MKKVVLLARFESAIAVGLFDARDTPIGQRTRSTSSSANPRATSRCRNRRTVAGPRSRTAGPRARGDRERAINRCHS